jgi:hypothetical protein
MYLAAADEITRQRCICIIEAASSGTAMSSVHDIALTVALTRDLLKIKSFAAIQAVLAALGVAMDHPSLKAVGFDFQSLKEKEGFDCAAFRASGFDWSTIRTAGFTAAEVKAAGCDFASAQSAGFDVPSLVVAFGYNVVTASGVDLSSRMLVRSLLFPCICTHA